MRKRVHTKLIEFTKGFSVEKLQGRLTGPRVLANSIPKSGTNLLRGVLANMPGLRIDPRRTLNYFTWDVRADEALRNLSKGAVRLAHLPADSRYFLALECSGINSILMIRDPRDVLVSNYEYVTKIDLTHPTHVYLSSLPNDSARLSACILGFHGMAGVKQLWSIYEPWLDNQRTMVCRFENLVGDSGGGCTNLQRCEVKNIANHVGLRLSEERLDLIVSRAFTKRSSTFNKGRIGSWRESFDDANKALFKQETGDLLIKLGYELNDRW